MSIIIRSLRQRSSRCIMWEFAMACVQRNCFGTWRTNLCNTEQELAKAKMPEKFQKPRKSSDMGFPIFGEVGNPPFDRIDMKW